MKIASWNVNSIKARFDHVADWLAEAAPDVLMLQELKGVEFPAAEFLARGYDSVFVSQKAYNGVAILSREKPAVVAWALPGDESDEQARFLEIDLNGFRLINIYLPNGNPVDTEKFTYKLRWLDRLKTHLAALRRQNVPVIVGGDFNVIPEGRDCYNPGLWENDALFRLETRQRFRALLNLGFTDAFRVFNQEAGQYTFWDYQAGALHNNMGLRIDHFLLSPAAADRLQACAIDAAPRHREKASDHTPIIVTLRD